MGLNLSSLCGADPGACSWKPPTSAIPAAPPPPASPCASGQHAQPCAAGEYIDPATGCCLTLSTSSPAMSALAAKIGTALYRIAATLGCRTVCPQLPTLSSALGAALLGGTSIVLTEGLAVSISAAEGAVLGSEVGLAVQREICSGCQ